MMKPWSLPHLYRGSSYRNLVATTSPKKHKIKDAYPNTSDSSVSATSISGESLSSLEKSPFGLSIPDLEEYSGAEMGMMPALLPPTQAQLVKPVNEIPEDFANQVSLPSLNETNSLRCCSPTTSERRNGVTTYSEERVLWMPPLDHWQDELENNFELPDSPRKINEKPAKEPKKHHRKSSTASMTTIASTMGWVSAFEGGEDTHTSRATPLPKSDNPFLSEISHCKLKMVEGQEEKEKCMQAAMRLSAAKEVDQAFSSSCGLAIGEKEEEKGEEPPQAAATGTDSPGPRERTNWHPVKPRSASTMMANSPSMLHAIRKLSTTTNTHQMPEYAVKVGQQEDNEPILATRPRSNRNSFQKVECDTGRRTKQYPDKPRSTSFLMESSPSRLRVIGKLRCSSRAQLPELPVSVDEQTYVPQSIGMRYSLNSAGVQKVQKVDSHPAKPRSTSALTGNRMRVIRRLACSSKAEMPEPPVTVREKPKRQKSGAKPRSLRNMSHRGSLKLGANGLSSLIKPSRFTNGPATTELNIFCSEMVSTDFILSQITDAKHNADIVTLEIEDLLGRLRVREIALALEDLLNYDDRPWEGVRFVDEVQLDGSSSYRPWMQRKRYLVKVGNLKLIPIKFTTRVTVQEQDDKRTEASTSDGLVALLQDLQNDVSVTELRFSSKNSTLAIVEELTNLFQCDNRKWKSVTLQLSGTGPFPKGSNEHAEWCKEMQASGMLMQKVAEERGILLT